MSVKKPEERFYDNIISLAHLVIELIRTIYDKGYKTVNPDLCVYATKMLEKYPGEEMIKNFIYYSYPYWNEILRREENYFISRAGDIFRDIPIQNVDAFRTLFEAKDEKTGKHIIEKEDRDAIIDFFQSFVKISVHYINKNHHDPTKTYFYIEKDKDGKDITVIIQDSIKEVELHPGTISSTLSFLKDYLASHNKEWSKKISEMKQLDDLKLFFRKTFIHTYSCIPIQDVAKQWNVKI